MDVRRRPLNFYELEARIYQLAEINEGSVNRQWRKVAENLLDNCEQWLTAWEVKFLASITPKHWPLSDKQRRKIHQIYYRVMYRKPQAVVANAGLLWLND
jgi:hypothetical protein